MKTSRLKNIVIVILLLVNAFLLFLLLSRRAEERDSNERRVEQLCTLFEKNGVAFDRALLPDEETHLSLSLERDAAREEAFASALLGTAESSDSGGGVSRFTGEYGSFCPRSTRAAAQTASTRSTRLCIFWTIAAFRASCVPRSERWTKGIFSRRRLPRRFGCKACGASPRMSAVIM